MVRRQTAHRGLSSIGAWRTHYSRLAPAPTHWILEGDRRLPVDNEQVKRRLADLRRFYAVLDQLAQQVGGPRHLVRCHGRLAWPPRGVYFFYEEGQDRSNSGDGLRVVRVGTHALAAGSRTSLWNRLSSHRGNGSGGGNHRGSIFRLLVGAALKSRAGIGGPMSWGVGADPGAAGRRLGLERADILRAEAALEAEVSSHIGAMPFLWLAVGDAAGPQSQRGYIERNAIALLSNCLGAPLDAPSPSWLGHHCERERVRRSGLWNQNHTDEGYDPAFLDALQALVGAL